MELKPCPFCGGAAHIEQVGNNRHSTIYECGSCGCHLETGEEFNHGSRWNKRPETDQLRAENERLKAELAEANARHARQMASIQEANGVLAEELAALRQQLLNLVCRIHRDGGHYIAEHGEAKAIADADLVAAQNNADLDSLKAELAETKETARNAIELALKKWAELNESLEQRVSALRSELQHETKLWKDYEELRKLIDGGSESMTHEDAVKELKRMVENDSASSEPVAWRWLVPIPGGTWSEHYSDEKPTPVGKKDITPLYLHPQAAQSKDALASSEPVDNEVLKTIIVGAIHSHMSIPLYPKEVAAAAEYIVKKYCTAPSSDNAVETPISTEGIERECCGTFFRTPHRSTCKHFRGKKDAIEKKTK